jgi:uncharacterized protein YgbK (DUF1537 family)
LSLVLGRRAQFLDVVPSDRAIIDALLRRLQRRFQSFIESTKKTISAARAAGQVDAKTLKEIEAAAAGMKEVTKKVNTARMQKMEAALEAAIAAAKQCTDDCPAAWEEVEEISAAKSREEGRD